MIVVEDVRLLGGGGKGLDHRRLAKGGRFPGHDSHWGIAVGEAPHLHLEGTLPAATSLVPSTAAASAGTAEQASGMCPSPQNNPLVASRPIQPAPGRNTSAQACRASTSFGTPVA